MDPLPALDLSIVETDPCQWPECYGNWVDNCRISVNSPEHQKVFVDVYDSHQMKTFFVLPPIPDNQIPRFKHLTITTRNSTIGVRINAHNLSVSAFEVRGVWFVFKGADITELLNVTFINVDESYTQIIPKICASLNVNPPRKDRILLGMERMVAAVNSIHSNWNINGGEAFIDESKAKACVVLFQMISESIRFHPVREILSGLVFVDSDWRRHHKIWKYQNVWEQMGKDIHAIFGEGNFNEENSSVLSHYYRRVCVIKSHIRAIAVAGSSGSKDGRSGFKKGGRANKVRRSGGRSGITILTLLCFCV